MYCISDGSLAVALDSAAGHESQSQKFGAVCLTVALLLNCVAHVGILSGETFRSLLVPNPEAVRVLGATVN